MRVRLEMMLPLFASSFLMASAWVSPQLTAITASGKRFLSPTARSMVSAASTEETQVRLKEGSPTNLESPTAMPLDNSLVNNLENETTSSSYQAIFDFSVPETIDKIERLDDAIMGGISTSSIRPAEGFARWSGVCRTDGGGFCGWRTNPFTKPLLPGSADGFYAVLRLASDADAQRRVWKFSTRVKPDRGELLYQAPVAFDQSTPDKWSLVKVPFDSFRLVRGPRFVDGGSPLNATTGLHQVGMTMSQFEFGGDLKAIDNFRDGFFELQIREIGLYKDDKAASLSSVAAPMVLAKEEARKKKPLLLKVLKPIARVFFSEQRIRFAPSPQSTTETGHEDIDSETGSHKSWSYLIWPSISSCQLRVAQIDCKWPVHSQRGQPSNDSAIDFETGIHLSHSADEDGGESSADTTKTNSVKINSPLHP